MVHYMYQNKERLKPHEVKSAKIAACEAMGLGLFVPVLSNGKFGYKRTELGEALWRSLND